GYLVWIVVISSEKLGIATAMVSASYYLLTASAAWIIFGERLSIMQWLGISLITLGVVCVTLATSR
ncbi:MAG: EamA family transporter, partial [Burkholderiales bacterium]